MGGEREWVRFIRPFQGVKGEGGGLKSRRVNVFKPLKCGTAHRILINYGTMRDIRIVCLLLIRHRGNGKHFSDCVAGMKEDMGGAAGMLSSFYTLVKSGFNQNLHCLLCIAENSVSPEAK